MNSTPGKTAPRLLEDLRCYDPRTEASHGRNILTDPPPLVDLQSSRPAIQTSTYRHEYTTKYSQSVLPKAGSSPDNSTVYKVASFCQTSRNHLDLIVDFRGDSARSRPCPDQDNPLHHFVFQRPYLKGQSTSKLPHDYTFRCTAEQCPATARIRIRPPRLTDADITLLTDAEILEERYQAAVRVDPQRVGLRSARPVDVLNNLRSYLGDCLDTSGERKRIAMRNRRFLVSFGQDCDHLLRRLGFSEQSADEQCDGFWALPIPPAASDPLSEETPRTHIEDVLEELSVLIANETRKEGQPFLNSVHQPMPSSKDFQRALGCLDYPKSPSSRRTTDLTGEEDPCYAALGALKDFSDELIIYAHQRQVLSDSDNSPYYFDCLRSLAAKRQSEALMTRESELMAQGQMGLAELIDAYRYLGIDYKHAKVLSDQQILDKYQARYPDVGPAEQEKMRGILKKVGQARGSPQLQQEAQGTVETYHDALTWLGAISETAEETIVELVRAKIQENPANQQTGLRALRVIAQNRNSDYLRSSEDAITGGVSTMSFEEACRILGLDINGNYDIEMVGTQAEVFQQDAKDAQQQKQIQQAYDTYVNHSRSNKSGGSEAALTQPSVTHPPATWPVGLENIGNTCYLNSLLQYFFTIKPIRDVVLDFDAHRMALTPETIQHKKVGGRNITVDEVERAQNFVLELRKLFHSMIVASGYKVTPTKELARLTLLDPKKPDPKATPITSENNGSSLGAIDGVPVSGPLPQSVETEGNASITPVSQGGSSDTASDITLIGDVMTPDSDDQAMESVDPQELAQGEKANDALDKEGQSHQLSSPKSQKSPKRRRSDSMADASPPKVTRQDSAADLESIGKIGAAMQSASNQLPSTEPSPPSRQPPPVPPRPQTVPQNQNVLEEAARQQDVTEVMGHVLFQLECAIKSESAGGDAEQTNVIQRLLYGDLAWSYLGRDIVGAKETFSNLVLYITNGPRNIYDAIDDALGLQSAIVGGETTQRWATIHRLPPVLQFYVNRVGFDPQTKTQFKIDDHLGLEEVLYMDQYLDFPDTELLRARQQSWRWRRDLEKLEARKSELLKTDVDMSIPDALDSTAEYLSGLDAEKEDDDQMASDTIPVSSALVEDLRHEATEHRQELERLNSEVDTLASKRASLFANCTSVPYRLHAVFIHRGATGSGHYWIYIHDFANNIWRKYNDQEVEEVKDLKEIFDQQPPPQKGLNVPTPYFVVYVRDEQKDELVNAVCRIPEDVEMQDGVEVINGVAPQGSWDTVSSSYNNGRTW